ncbi:MAG: FAD-dependent oxidoreductase [Verrucomicrobia bacterium]|nr:FAD-dependent oxidoreductase [Verrucomicrobiota bacterium]
MAIGTLQAKAPIEEEIQNVTIFGSGVGALTSAVYLQRAGINTLIIEGRNPGGAIAQSPLVHNWPGEIAIDGQTLVDKIRKQAIHNGAKIVHEEVISVDFSKQPLTVTTRDVFDKEKIRTFKTRACIIATGSTPKLLGVPGESGENGYWTRGVYSCAVCDGALYKDKVVAVIGGGDSAITEANYLSNIAKKVYVIIRSDKFKTVELRRKEELAKKPNVEILYNTKINDIQGDGTKVTHLNLSTAKKLPIDGIFVAIGANPNSSIFKGQLDLEEETGYIKAKNVLQTSVPGVYAIGDVVDKVYKQAISAAGDGAKAALEVEAYLSNLPDKFHRAAPQIKTETVVKINNKTSEGLDEITTKEAFYDIVGTGNTPVVIDFYSPYCVPCRSLLPLLEEAAVTYKGKIRFYKINVTDFAELATSYNISSVPTVMVFDGNGKIIEQATGIEDIHKILKKLDSIKASD